MSILIPVALLLTGRLGKKPVTASFKHDGLSKSPCFSHAVWRASEPTRVTISLSLL